jgi:hypothetical protein
VARANNLERSVPMKDFTNADRAKRAKAALKRYNGDNDAITNVVDLLADLQHFFYDLEHAKDIIHPTFDDALASARRHFEDEQAELAMSTTSAQDKSNPPPQYSIGINNDDGDCYDIVIKQGDRPIATVIAPEGEVEPLVRAGNCHQTLIDALKVAQTAIEEATDIMLYEEGQPVTFLESHEIERAYTALVSILVQVHEAVNAGASV